MEERVAVVTGGGSGIGAATSRRLAADGFRVAIWDLNESGARAVADRIKADGGVALAVQVNVADAQAVNLALEVTNKNLGPPVALVNCAGIRDLTPFLDITAEDWNKIITVCLSGPFFCTQAVAPAMKKLGGGAIVNVASICALTSRPDRTAYVAAKTGLLGFTRSTAQDLGPSGIRVNSVAPGFISTPLQAQSLQRPESQNMIAAVPLRRVGQPEDVADVISFLCSDASRYVTGTIIPVDGGRMVVG